VHGVVQARINRDLLAGNPDVARRIRRIVRRLASDNVAAADVNVLPGL